MPMTHAPETGTKNRYQRTCTSFLQVCFKKKSAWQRLSHVACRNAPPPPIGVILHEVYQLFIKTRQDKCVMRIGIDFFWYQNLVRSRTVFYSVQKTSNHVTKMTSTDWSDDRQLCSLLLCCLLFLHVIALKWIEATVNSEQINLINLCKF